MSGLFHNGTVIDGTGRAFRGYVWVEEHTIRRVGAGEPPGDIPPAVERVDLAGQRILPGFIDCHVHLCLEGGPHPAGQITSESYAMTVLRAARNARLQVESGVTTVRDVGSRCCADPVGPGGISINLRRAIAEGICPGPRAVAAGSAITMTGGHSHWMGKEANGPSDVRRVVRGELKEGVDLIKFMATGGIATLTSADRFAPQLTTEEMAGGVEEARKAGKRTAAHAEGAAGIKNALAAGVDSIEHGTYLDEEAIDLMMARGVYYVPTFAVRRRIAEEGERSGVPTFILEVVKRVVDQHRRSLEKARAAGVRVAVGTDTGAPLFRHGETMKELEEMVGVGFPPMEAILAATRNAADLLGMGDLIGTVEEGKRADLLVLDGDPLTDIRVLQDRARIKAVLVDGHRVVDRLSRA